LSKVENSLENFRLSNRLIDLSREGTSIQNRLESYENERGALMLQRQYYVYLQEYVSSKMKQAILYHLGQWGYKRIT